MLDLNFTYTVRPDNVRATLTPTPVADGIVDLHIAFDFDAPTRPGEIRISWVFPIHEVIGVWTPSALYDRSIGVNWHKRQVNSRQSSGAPVLTCLSPEGNNVLTIGVSDAKTPIAIAAGVVEKTGEEVCEVKFFTSDIAPITHYEAAVRLDARPLPFTDTVQAIAAWWETDCGYPRADVPEVAYLPVNSAWYSYHQELDADTLIRECALSARYGLKTLIIDDGWQTANNSRGYAYCGDWQLCREKIPDMRDLVDRIHALEMKVMLWYSVPFIGIHAEAYERFKDKALYHRSTDLVADPRYPEIRSYLIGCYADALRDWDLDGFKLDFVDSIQLKPESPDLAPGMDFSAVEDAVEQLFADIVATLSAIKPDLLFEFRQSYIGPSILKYGNMIRVGDCPYNALRNRVAIVDLRLTSGKTAVHSDMLMWRPDDTVEAACLQIQATLLGVPQISVRLDELPEDHREALEFWMHFATDHREALQGGHLSVSHPEQSYAQVRSATADEAITVNYLPLPFVADETPLQFFVNSTYDRHAILRFADGVEGQWQCSLLDCCGHVIANLPLDAADRLYEFALPPCGMIAITRI